jgi:hypothetical protein
MLPVQVICAQVSNTFLKGNHFSNNSEAMMADIHSPATVEVESTNALNLAIGF